mmetsp:Transcript_21834/g.33336  ORF Transcript_21834/g.33336 Transcript_21834/m.33336 type:complete len:202 (+) Transcript_21834:104-709(+)
MEQIGQLRLAKPLASLTLVILLNQCQFSNARQGSDSACFVSPQNVRRSSSVGTRFQQRFSKNFPSADPLLKGGELDEFDDIDLTGFNPFDKQAGFPKSSLLRKQGSIRQVLMSQIMSELLEASGDVERMELILLKNKDFLLEILENDNAAMDLDSVIKPGMARSQRYEVYMESMTDRIDRARDPTVKKVLTTMMQFVQKFQ